MEAVKAARERRDLNQEAARDQDDDLHDAARATNGTRS
jgi:hypothetical protein